jgi:Phage integrase, N-terminal SAM-like domain
MTGHVRRRGTRSWELKYDAATDPLTGRRRVRYVSFKGTKRDAERELTRLVAQEGAGQGVDPSKATLSEFLDRWERDWAVLHTSPKTFERYSELLRRQVRPHLGHVRIQKLRPVMLADLYAKLMRETGLAARTVGHVHRGQWGVIQQNPADNVSPPPVQASEVQILRSDDVQTILERLCDRKGRLLSPSRCYRADSAGVSCSHCAGATLIWTPANCPSSARSSRLGSMVCGSSRPRPSTDGAPFRYRQRW